MVPVQSPKIFPTLWIQIRLIHSEFKLNTVLVSLQVPPIDLVRIDLLITDNEVLYPYIISDTFVDLTGCEEYSYTTKSMFIVLEIIH